MHRNRSLVAAIGLALVSNVLAGDGDRSRDDVIDQLRAEVAELRDTVAELKIPVLYHPGRVSQFHLIAANYPQINFIMAHLGVFASRNWTEHIAAIDIARRYPNVYLETSSVVFFRFLEMAVKELGPERVIFGTDGPRARFPRRDS